MRVPFLLCAVSRLLAACDNPPHPPRRPRSARGSQRPLGRTSTCARSARRSRRPRGCAVPGDRAWCGRRGAYRGFLADDAAASSSPRKDMVGRTAIATFLTSDPIAPSALSCTTINVGGGPTTHRPGRPRDLSGRPGGHRSPAGPAGARGLARSMEARRAVPDCGSPRSSCVSSGRPEQMVPIPDGFGHARHQATAAELPINTDAAAQAAAAPRGGRGLLRRSRSSGPSASPSRRSRRRMASRWAAASSSTARPRSGRRSPPPRTTT